MPNKVFINTDGFEEMVFEGVMTAQGVIDIIQASFEFDKKLSEKSDYIDTIIDLSGATEMTDDAMTASFQGLKATHYDKIAMYGANEQVTGKVSMAIAQAGVGDKVKLFDTRDAATTWLQEPKYSGQAGS